MLSCWEIKFETNKNETRVAQNKETVESCKEDEESLIAIESKITLN